MEVSIVIELLEPLTEPWVARDTIIGGIIHMNLEWIVFFGMFVAGVIVGLLVKAAIEAGERELQRWQRQQDVKRDFPDAKVIDDDMVQLWGSDE